MIANELDRYCRESDELADFKRPQQHVFIKDVPKKRGKKLRRKPRVGDLEDIDLSVEVNVELTSD